MDRHWTQSEVTGCFCALGNYLNAMAAPKYISRKPVPERTQRKATDQINKHMSHHLLISLKHRARKGNRWSRYARIYQWYIVYSSSKINGVGILGQVASKKEAPCYPDPEIFRYKMLTCFLSLSLVLSPPFLLPSPAHFLADGVAKRLKVKGEQ